MPSYTTEQVLALAPDAASARAGRELASARKWQNLGHADGILIWGEVQGSGKQPYRSALDLNGPAYSCPCPSRKFPCKHALGLLLLQAQDTAMFTAAAPPDWVQKWMEARVQRAEKQADKVEKKRSSEADPEAAAERAKQRERRVAASVQGLQTWLDDVLNSGLAHAQAQPPAFWLAQARRLVDAQAPGLAALVARGSEIAASGSGWQSRLLAHLARLHLLMDGYARLDSLPAPVQADVSAQIGWTQSQEELLLQPGRMDCWRVLGQSVREEERLIVQRNWLRGEASGQDALILNFGHASQPPDSSLVPDTCFQGELVFYPGNLALRALVKSREAALTDSTAPANAQSIAAALAAYGAALARHPWLRHWPCCLNSVNPQCDGDVWYLVDAAGHALPVARRFERNWALAAVGGGHGLTVFGEWDGEALLPLTAWTATGRIAL